MGGRDGDEAELTGVEGATSARRSRLEIVYRILELLYTMGPLRKTRLMQLANLNTRSFPEYVDGFLVRLGMVSKRELGRGALYAITPRGRALYTLLRSLAEAGLLGEKRYDNGGAAGIGFIDSYRRLIHGRLGIRIRGEQVSPGFYRASLVCGDRDLLLYVVPDARGIEAYLAVWEALTGSLRGRGRYMVVLGWEDNGVLWLEGGRSVGLRSALVMVRGPGEEAPIVEALDGLGCKHRSSGGEGGW